MLLKEALDLSEELICGGLDPKQVVIVLLDQGFDKDKSEKIVSWAIQRCQAKGWL